MKNIPSLLKSYALSFLSVSCVLTLATLPGAIASDHVDSPMVTINPGPTTGVDANGRFITVPPAQTPMGKVEDIADVYLFREGDQTGNAEDNKNMVFILTTNGFTAPGKANQFATDLDYVFKIATDKNNLSANQRNIIFRFGPPNQNGQQNIIVNGKNAGMTSLFNKDPIVYQVNLDGAGQSGNYQAKVYAGENDDPFFLDFRIITEGLGAGVNGPGSVNMTRSPADTFGNSNVNTLAISVPVTWLQEGFNPAPSTFYVWGTTNR